MLLVIFGINSYFDPFADFFYLTGWRPHPIVRIDNYADVKFKSGLLKYLPRNYIDAAVFGSSRPLRINSECPGFKELGKHTFNLAMQGASLATVDRFVRMACAKNPNMLVIIGLDFFAFDTPPKPIIFYLDSKKIPAAWGDALMRLIDIQTLQESLKDPNRPTRHRMLPDGNALFNPTQKEKDAVPAYLEKYSHQTIAEIPAFKNYVYDPTQIEWLKKLKKDHPHIIFFINPESKWYHPPLDNSRLAPEVRTWRNDVATLGGVVDFSECKEITDNSSMYLDEHHYLAPAGNLIMEDIANAAAGRPLQHGKILQPDTSTPKSTP